MLWLVLFIIDINGHTHTHPQSLTQSIKQTLIVTGGTTDYHSGFSIRLKDSIIIYLAT